MNCPNCNHHFKYFSSWKLINPNNCHCPNCSTPLKLTGLGKRTMLISYALGLLIAIVAIIMEEYKMWSTVHSLIFFSIIYPSVVIVLSYILWKYSNFQIRNYKNSIINKNVLLNLLFIPFFFLILSFFSFFFASKYHFSKSPPNASQVINAIDEGTFKLSEYKLKKIIKLNIEADILRAEAEAELKKTIIWFSFILLFFSSFQILTLLIFYKQTKESIDNMFDSKTNDIK